MADQSSSGRRVRSLSVGSMPMGGRQREELSPMAPPNSPVSRGPSPPPNSPTSPPSLERAVAAATTIQRFVRGHLVRRRVAGELQRMTPYGGPFHFRLATGLPRDEVRDNFAVYKSTERHALHSDTQPHEALLHRRGAKGGERYTELYNKEMGSQQRLRQESGLQYTPFGGHDMTKNRSWLLGVMHRQIPVRNVAPTALDDMSSSSHPLNVSAHTKELLMMAQNPNYQAHPGRYPWETEFRPMGQPDVTTMRDLVRQTEGVDAHRALQTLASHRLPIEERRADTANMVLDRLHPPSTPQVDVAPQARTLTQQQRLAELQAKSAARVQAIKRAPKKDE